jgi:hypothetical protein
MAALAAHVLGASLLVTAAPADAAPVFTDSETSLQAGSGAFTHTKTGGSGTCDSTDTGGTGPAVSVIENGGAASTSSTAAGTFTGTGVPGDTATGVATATGTGQVTSVGGHLSTLDLVVTSTAELVNALGTSANCIRGVNALVELEFELTVTSPGFLELSTTATGGADGTVTVHGYEAGSPEDTYLNHFGHGFKFDATTRIFLPTGTYRGGLQGGISVPSFVSYALSGTTTLHGEFHVVGSQTAAISGKGRRYVTLPGARSCATPTLAPRITGKKKRASQVKQVRFFVDGKQVKKVRTPDKGDAIRVPLADSGAVDVVAEVGLVSKRKGKRGKVVVVRTSYEACS